MSECTVLIAAADLLPALKERTRVDGIELLAFADTEALRALDIILKRRPSVVSLEQAFAATSRGTALINRIKADPSLTGAEVRILGMEPATVSAEESVLELNPDVLSASMDIAPTSASLDGRGTRRARRYAIAIWTDVLIDGNPSTLVDLSVNGAQVVSPTVLRPNQRVRISISDDVGVVRAAGTIVWASFEIPTGLSPRYRAGIGFVNADAAALEAFCLKHGSEVSPKPV